MASRCTVASRLRCHSCEWGTLSEGSRTVRYLAALPRRVRSMKRTVCSFLQTFIIRSCTGHSVGYSSWKTRFARKSTSFDEQSLQQLSVRSRTFRLSGRNIQHFSTVRASVLHWIEPTHWHEIHSHTPDSRLFRFGRLFRAMRKRAAAPSCGRNCQTRDIFQLARDCLPDCVEVS
jgi:hypothetical protein